MSGMGGMGGMRGMGHMGGMEMGGPGKAEPSSAERLDRMEKRLDTIEQTMKGGMPKP